MSKENWVFSDPDDGRIDIWMDGPDYFSTEQTTEEVQTVLDSAKTGDVVHILPKGDKQFLCVSNGIYQVHGAVDPASPEGKVTVWSTYFAFAQKAFSQEKARTFGSDDINVIYLEKAEDYIPRATDGEFQYLSQARVQDAADKKYHTVKVDSFFDGIISAALPDGRRIIGGASFFKPLKPKKQK